MKKVILSIVLCIATLSTVSANTPLTNNTVEVNYPDLTTFFKLIKEGNYSAVEAMIKNGEDVNKKSKGLTPLMYAARYNKADIVKLLIDNGAKLKAKSERGFTALKWAQLAKADKSIAVIKNALKK